MKKTKRAGSKLRTTIRDISGLATGLSPDQLRLVAGGMKNLGGLGGWGRAAYDGTNETTHPASITEPGQTDTATDTKSD